jgi:hypothetical protein
MKLAPKNLVDTEREKREKPLYETMMRDNERDHERDLEQDLERDRERDLERDLELNH